jgi:hypothetical protein
MSTPSTVDTMSGGGPADSTETRPNWPIRATLTISSFALSFLAGMVTVSTAHVGVARLLAVLAFLSIAPGAAFLNLLLPELADWATTLLLAVGASLTLDVAAAEVSLWAHVWNPVAVVGTLAMLTVTLSGLSLVRLQMPFAFPVPTVRFPDWSRRLAYVVAMAFPFVALLVGVVLDHPRRALTGVAGGVGAAFAAVAVVLVMFGTTASDSPRRRLRSLVLSSVLVAFVAVIVAARFILIG